jgi:hypothetical protein
VKANRGAAASWHGSGAPRRHARRVVSAAPDARTSFGGWLATALKRRAARLILFDLEIYRRLLTAVTLNLVLNGLSFIERCQSGTFDGTDVYEHIFSTSLRLNEPVAFGRIEPLHSAGSHAGLLLNRLQQSSSFDKQFQGDRVAPVQGMQGEVEIIYQILGSDRQRMVSAAPHARTSFGVTGIRTESLPLAVSVSGKRDFGAREKCAETHLPIVTMPSLRTNRRTDPANSGLFVLFQEISGSIRLRGGPGSSDTRQSGQWLACQTAPKGPFERKRVSQQVSKLER